MEIKEIWKDVIGYENLYQISNLGRIKNNRGKILKLKTDTNYYLSIRLSKLNRKKYYLIHRLVATHFLPNPQNKSEIDHIDTNRQNNCVSNLRWVTKKENRNNPITLINYSKAKKGRVFSQETKDKMSKAKSKPIVQIHKSGLIIGVYDSAIQASKELGIYQQSITACCKGKYKTCNGYQWKYLNEIKKAG